MHYVTVFDKGELMSGYEHSAGLIDFGIWDWMGV